MATSTPFDGCDADCKNEPDCDGGVCQAVCGDAVILPGTSEACDDGNTNDGDGCSSTCQVEDGFECELSPVDLGDERRDSSHLQGFPKQRHERPRADDVQLGLQQPG